MNYNAAYNGYQSGLRNSFLVSSIGISLILFSNFFDVSYYKYTMKILGLLILILSIAISLLNIRDFSSIINDNDAPVFTKKWKSWFMINYYHIFIVTLVILMVFLYT
jgi:uncharacterized membrane protein YidH (DUF202 family)